MLFFPGTHTVTQDETYWGLWWNGSYRLGHITHFSTEVAVLFQVSPTTSILSYIEVVKGHLLNVQGLCLFSLMSMPQTMTQREEAFTPF